MSEYEPDEEAKKKWEELVAQVNADQPANILDEMENESQIDILPSNARVANTEYSIHVKHRGSGLVVVDKNRETAIEKALISGDSGERDDRTTMDKVIQMNLGIKPRTLVLPTGMTEDGIKKWTADYIEASKPGWMFERLDDRQNKIFAKPIDFAVLGGNQLILTGGDAAYSRNFDIGLAIYNEIENHGRTTPDELKKHIEGVNPALLFIVVNMMLLKDYLCLYTEKDGTQTLELVDEKVRDRRIAIQHNLALDSLVDIDEESRYLLSVLPRYTAYDDLS